MRYFITGASGHVGKSLVKELVSQGHAVVGLARSDASASAVSSLGATVLRGDIEDLTLLTRAASESDGVVHLAFKNDFSDIAGCVAQDKAAISALAAGLSGSGKPLAIASGTLLAPKGALATEDTAAERDAPPFSLRAESADLIYQLSREQNIRGAVVRFAPTVHGRDDHGLIPMAVESIRKNGAVPYVEGASNVWPAVHKDDLAVLLGLILEKGTAGTTYNAVAEQGVPVMDILTAVSEKTGLPMQKVEPAQMMQALGFVGAALLQDNPTSSEKTQRELGWKPTNLRLIEDMKANYF